MEEYGTLGVAYLEEPTNDGENNDGGNGDNDTIDGSALRSFKG